MTWVKFKELTHLRPRDDATFVTGAVAGVVMTEWGFWWALIPIAIGICVRDFIWSSDAR